MPILGMHTQGPVHQPGHHNPEFEALGALTLLCNTSLWPALRGREQEVPRGQRRQRLQRQALRGH